MSEFKREDRYIVIKRKDLGKVPVNYRSRLVDPMFSLLSYLPRRECLVIESDWPEYETVWRLIEARMTGTPVPPTGGEPYYYYADCEDTDYSCLCNNRADALTEVADHGGQVVELWNTPPDHNVTRLQAENAALHERLTIADQRVDDLEAQVAESRKITLSGCEFSEHELIARAVRAATGTSRRRTQRWVAMKDVFGCGSGVANALCRRFGFDPDEMVKP